MAHLKGLTNLDILLVIMFSNTAQLLAVTRQRLNLSIEYGCRQ
jgi:hypothetical protein